MHRFLCGEDIDHQNRDRFDNRRNNLRPCTHQQNVWNRGAWGSTPFKGVNEHTEGVYRARINNRHLGLFKCPIEAALAYDEAARRLHGEFALTNAMLGLLDEAAA